MLTEWEAARCQLWRQPGLGRDGELGAASHCIYGLGEAFRSDSYIYRLRAAAEPAFPLPNISLEPTRRAAAKLMMPWLPGRGRVRYHRQTRRAAQLGGVRQPM
jgi:hypothetical protein